MNKITKMLITLSLVFAILTSNTQQSYAAPFRHPNPEVEQWHQVALDAGWDESQWPRLACIIQRESGGWYWVHNTRDPGYGSFGLMQINMSKGKFGTWAKYAPILSYNMDALLDPAVNFAVALDLYNRSWRAYRNGWQPWGRGCRV